MVQDRALGGVTLFCSCTVMGFKARHVTLTLPLPTQVYTAISIFVVGSKLPAYATRPNGGLGIHWNLHRL